MKKKKIKTRYPAAGFHVGYVYEIADQPFKKGYKHKASEFYSDCFDAQAWLYMVKDLNISEQNVAIQFLISYAKGTLILSETENRAFIVGKKSLFFKPAYKDFIKTVKKLKKTKLKDFTDESGDTSRPAPLMWRLKDDYEARVHYVYYNGELHTLERFLREDAQHGKTYYFGPVFQHEI